MIERPRHHVQELFDRAVALPPADREAFLETACAGDPTLRAEVESLLAWDAKIHEGADDEGLLKSPLIRLPEAVRSGTGERAVNVSPRDLVTLSSPGRYRIKRRIAEGGMGAVYEAEQDSPRRSVALKVIRPGLASPALIKRFSHEAQILGRLQHPGIAQVYEAGLTDDGQPYFAMEYIHGLALNEYAAERGLNLLARVSLVARVCDAVQHAHDRGVIHRDLKPANILVEETGQPKVLDFGIARVTDADLLTGTGLTQTGQLLGTLRYMSPEQVTANPNAIDRRADIYSLGVILFELVAHRPPYQLENRPLTEAARLILEQDPPLLGSIASELRGDLETIVARALEKDPARRYQSAAELAADLRHWLAHEPILARPSSTFYHLRKFAHRNKALVGGVVATGAALILGLIGTVLFAVAEARQRSQAEHNAQVANDEKREAQSQAYRARVSAAVAALQNLDVLDASRHLSAVPEVMRGWEWRHLRSRLDDSASVVRLPVAESGHLIATQERIRVATRTSDGLYVLDLAGSEPRPLPIRVESGRPDGVAQTCRGLRVVTWTSHTTFVLLDESGRLLCTVEVPEIGRPHPVIVSPDGTRMATCWSRDGKTQLDVFDATSGKRMASSHGLSIGSRLLCFSPNGTRLATAGDDRSVQLRNADTGALVSTCQGHAERPLSATFSADGIRLATTSSDGTVRQWEAATGQELGPPYERHSGSVLTAAFSPDGQWIASAGTDRTIRVWRATDRRDVALLLGHMGCVVEVAFDANGRRLASLSTNSWLQYAGDDTVRLWEIDPRATLPALRGHVGTLYAVAYSPDGQWLASGSGDGMVRLWDAATGEPYAALPHPGGVWSLAFSPDSRRLVSTTTADNRLRIWDVATARLCKEIPVPGASQWYVAVSPDGNRIAATVIDPRDGEYYLHVCDFNSGERLFSAKGWAMAYSPDGRWLAALDADGRTVLLLDASTHQTIARFRGHEKWVFKVIFSPDGHRLASCSEDRTVRLWEIDSGECQVLRGHTDEVHAVAFHPDGTRLASGGQDRTVWLWDLARGEEVARLQGHSSFVWSVAFSPDGATLASGSGDFTARLWDTAPLKERYQARRVAEVLRPKSERLVEYLSRQTNTEPKSRKFSGRTRQDTE